MENLKKLIGKPYCLKLEMTRGCNIRCKFCVVYHDETLQDPEQRVYATPEMTEFVARGIANLNAMIRIELTGRGEPTLNPKLPINLIRFRKYLPYSQIVLFTNGMVLLKDSELLGEYFYCGANIVNIDCYNNTYDRFKELATKVVEKNPHITLADYRTFPSHRKYGKGYKLKVINLIPDIQDDRHLVSTRKVHNQAGNLNEQQMKWFGLKKLEKPLEKMCKLPFTDYNILSDGIVNLCCHDWSEEYVMGKLPAQSVEEVWYGEKHLAALRSLHKRDRGGAPCNKCDYFGGARVGLVRNPFNGWDPYVR